MLKIHSTILDLIRAVAPTVAEIARQDRDLASQIRRALSSAALNVSEGSDLPGRRRALHYSIALGSSREALAGLLVAVAWGFIPPISDAITHTFDRIHATLYRVLHPR